MAWRVPDWAVPAALCGVLALGAADLFMMRHHPVTPHSRVAAEGVGLFADTDGEVLRVQWNRQSRPILNAERAILHIEDGSAQSQLDLTGRQLDRSMVRYWPESDQVTFRLEVYRGNQIHSESTSLAQPVVQDRRKRRNVAKAVVENTRPSPFERVEPEIVITQVRSAAMEPAPAVAAPRVGEADDRPSGFHSFLSKIPLLRRLQKHPPAGETEPR